MGSGVLVPATYAWGESTVQTLQTFGILLSVFKMVRSARCHKWGAQPKPGKTPVLHGC